MIRKNYEMPVHKEILDQNLDDDEILSLAAKYPYFERIMHDYVATHLEMYFMRKFEGMSLNKKIIGIFYQARLCFNLVSDDEKMVYPAILRSSMYYINPNYCCENNNNDIRKLFNSLSIGI